MSSFPGAAGPGFCPACLGVWMGPACSSCLGASEKKVWVSMKVQEAPRVSGQAGGRGSSLYSGCGQAAKTRRGDCFF